MDTHTLPVLGGPLDGLSVLAAQLEPLDIHPIVYESLGGAYELYDDSREGLVLRWVTGAL